MLWKWNWIWLCVRSTLLVHKVLEVGEISSGSRGGSRQALSGFLAHLTILLSVYFWMGSPSPARAWSETENPNQQRDVSDRYQVDCVFILKARPVLTTRYLSWPFLAFKVKWRLHAGFIFTVLRLKRRPPRSSQTPKISHKCLLLV